MTLEAAVTLVERIRNAIMLKAEEFDADDLCCMGAPTSQHGRNVATALARAAIEAMRELSVDDINACHMEPTPNNLAYYRAVFAAVLEEKA